MKNYKFRLVFDEPIDLDTKERRRRLRRMWIGLAVAAATLVFTFLVSIGFFAKIAGGGFTWTWRAPIASSLPEKDDYVVVSESGAGLRANTRIFESLFREHSVVRILGVPGDAVSNVNGKISINGNVTSFRGDIAGGDRLSAKYLVLCREGDCVPNTLYTIPTMNVLGETNYDDVALNERFLEE